jgi:hypothetical protein
VNIARRRILVLNLVRKQLYYNWSIYTQLGARNTTYATLTIRPCEWGPATNFDLLEPERTMKGHIHQRVYQNKTQNLHVRLVCTHY